MSSPSRPDTEGNKSTIRAYCAAIGAAQNTDALNELASVAYRSHFPGMPPMDREATQQYGNPFCAACPGLRHIEPAGERDPAWGWRTNQPGGSWRGRERYPRRAQCR